MEEAAKPTTRREHHPALVFATILGTAILIALAIGWRTNYLPPKWDTEYYVDMATHGLVGNRHLAAPFAYRPAVPLLIHALAGLLRISPEVVFRACGWLFCIVFTVSSFYFARFSNATFSAAWLASVLIALYYFTVKWTLFAGTMVDIYAYPLLLLAFAAMLRKRFYFCLLVCATGLFFKEFLLLPLLTQATVIVLEQREGNRKRLIKPLLLTGLVLLICFLLPRLLIHVGETFQDIDPLHNLKSLRLLIAYPINIKRDWNIVFYYLACWLPVLLLLTRGRAEFIWKRLKSHRGLISVYLTFHFLLVMYGGTNLDIFVTYTLPVELMVLSICLSEVGIQLWERVLTVAVVILFNRLWMYVPLPDQDINGYLFFYGGYHTQVTGRALARMGELLAFVLAFQWLRYAVGRSSGQFVSRELAPLTRSQTVQSQSPDRHAD